MIYIGIATMYQLRDCRHPRERLLQVRIEQILKNHRQQLTWRRKRASLGEQYPPYIVQTGFPILPCPAHGYNQLLKL